MSERGRGAGDGDPLRRIARLVEQARRRMSPERAFALLTACEELLKLIPRQERLW